MLPLTTPPVRWAELWHDLHREEVKTMDAVRGRGQEGPYGVEAMALYGLHKSS